VAKQRLGAQSLKLEEIANYYSDCNRSLRLYFSEKNPKFQDILIQYFPTELEDEGKIKLSQLRDRRIKELERSTSLILLSAIEAWFMNDVKQRQADNLNDPFSVDLINWTVNKDYLLLDDRLLELWKNHHPNNIDLIGRLKGALPYRHWLAHGRHFIPTKMGQHDYDYREIYQLAETILNNFPFEGF
jgi:hypothetical protein